MQWRCPLADSRRRRLRRVAGLHANEHRFQESRVPYGFRTAVVTPTQA